MLQKPTTNPKKKTLTEKMTPLVFLLATTLIATALLAKPALVGGGMLMLPLAVWHFRKGGVATFFPWQAAFFFALMTGLIFLSSLWSLDPGAALEGAGKFALIATAGIATLTMCQGAPLPKDRRILLLLPAAIFIGLALITLAAFGNFPLQRWWHEIPETQSISITVLNKSTAALLVMFGPIAVMGWTLGTGGRMLVAASLFLIGVLFTVTQSQSGEMGLLVFFTALFLLPVQRAFLFKGLAFTLIWGIILAPMIADAAFELLASAVVENPFIQAASVAPRLEIWDFIARRLYESPFVGFGYEGTRLITDFDTAKLFHPFTAIQHPHNSALQLWMEYGVLGATLGVYFVDRMLQSIADIKNLSVRRLYLASFLMMTAISLVGWGLWQTWWSALVILGTGLTILAGRVLKDQPRAAKESTSAPEIS